MMCLDRNINGNKDDKILEVWLVSCVTVRETHFSLKVKIWPKPQNLMNFWPKNVLIRRIARICILEKPCYLEDELLENRVSLYIKVASVNLWIWKTSIVHTAQMLSVAQSCVPHWSESLNEIDM